MFVERVQVKKQDKRKRLGRVYDKQLFKRQRKFILKRDPVCVICEREGRIIEAKEVDHIKPIAEGGAAYDTNNMQGVCKSCHSRKTMDENKAAIRSHGRK